MLHLTCITERLPYRAGIVVIGRRIISPTISRDYFRRLFPAIIFGNYLGLFRGSGYLPAHPFYESMVLLVQGQSTVNARAEYYS